MVRGLDVIFRSLLEAADRALDALKDQERNQGPRCSPKTTSDPKFKGWLIMGVSSKPSMNVPFVLLRSVTMTLPSTIRKTREGWVGGEGRVRSLGAG